MCLNLGGGNDNGQIFFKKFLEGGKWQRGKMTEDITVSFFLIFYSTKCVIISHTKKSISKIYSLISKSLFYF